ncbi:protein asteroid 1 [Caerostris extrusa]|uniref:Protein asteroid 1 n=1 Tax=Caerostris extrusa TaxID=172846 RepID=A0AAV4SJH2_CAEEX|nr:protein asteroid 1 [Caerostris extrusa]
MDGYKTQESNLMFVIDNNLVELEKMLKLDSKQKTPCGQTLPVPFMSSFHVGKMPAFFLNIINLHRTFLPSQVENISVESSYVCSRYIRQVIYGILLQHTAVDKNVHDEDCLRDIEEYDRRKGFISREKVSPVFSLKNGRPLPSLEELFSMDKSCSQQLLLDILGTDLNFVSTIPGNVRLLCCSIIYWLNNCNPAPKEDFVYALILNILYFQVVFKKSVQDESGCPEVENFEGLSISSLIDVVSTEDAMFAAQNIKKYLQKPSLNRGNPLILHIIHSFSQLQTCILYTLYLNSLLGFPFETPKLYETFAGFLLYNLTKDLSTRPFPDLFMSELLGRDSSLNALFNVLKNKIFENISEDSIERSDRSHLQKGKKDAKKDVDTKDKSSSTEDITSFCNHFENVNTHKEIACISDLGEVFI